MGSCHEPVFTFTCEVEIAGQQIVGRATGKTKQSAKKASAEDVLRIIQEKEIPLYTTNNIRKVLFSFKIYTILDPIKYWFPSETPKQWTE